jgi:hypothetical protein
MRGFFSILYILFIFAVVLLIYTYYQNLHLLNERNSIDFVKFELYSDRETDLKNFIIDSIKHEIEPMKGDESSDYVVESVAEKLSLLESYESWYEQNFDFDVDFWCGYINDIEIKNLTESMVEQKRAIKCSNCKDFDEMSVKLKYEDKKEVVPVRACSKFLSYSPIYIQISEDERVIWYLPPTGTPALGISIYDKKNGIASIVTFKEGTIIKKGWKN